MVLVSGIMISTKTEESLMNEDKLLEAVKSHTRNLGSHNAEISEGYDY